MADGNLLSKLVLSAIIVLFSLLFSCANVLGFLVRKLRRKANDYSMLWLEIGFNDVKWEKFGQSKKISVICPLPRENITNYIKC